MNKLIYNMDLGARFAMGHGDISLSRFLTNQLQTVITCLETKHYVASTFYIPREILEQYDVPVIYLERLVGYVAACKILKVEHSDKSIIPSEGCSYQKMFFQLLKDNLFPVPELIISSNFPCDDANIFATSLSKQYHIPKFEIEIIRNREEWNTNYIAEQYQKLNSFLALRYNKRNVYKEIVQQSNLANQRKKRIDYLRFKYPGILRTSEAFKIFTIFNDIGTINASSVLKSLLEELERRVENYKEIKNKKIFWLGIIPLYHNSLLDEIEKKYNCTFLFEELFYFSDILLSEKYIYQDLAKRIQDTIFFTTESRINFLNRIIDEFKIDGVIHFSHQNCRFLPPIVPIIRKNLLMKSVPFVELNADAVIPTLYNKERNEQNLEVFFEMINGGFEFGDSNY